MTKKSNKNHGLLGSMCLFRVMVYNATGKYMYVVSSAYSCKYQMLGKYRWRHTGKLLLHL